MTPPLASAESMKAWICPAYGPPSVLSLECRPKPRPGIDGVLIQIRATTVSSGDSRVRGLRLPRGFGPFGRLALGFRRPRKEILGTDLAGTVESVGANVTAYKPGDAVIAFPGSAMGCHAQYCVVPANGRVAPQPSNLSAEEAVSLLFGGSTALHYLRKAGLKAGESLLVIGASGAVGSAMVQLARHRGAKVTAVTSHANFELARTLGADDMIDYRADDFLRQSQTWDVIADSVGATSFSRCHQVLNEHGRYLAIAGTLGDMLARGRGTKRSIAGPAAELAEDVLELSRLAQAGALKPVIDQIFNFSQMPEAHARTDSGHKRGNVVVRVD
jgi:NADPH:quinone reductase-like Zn-dependent oxidoreductase